MSEFFNGLSDRLRQLNLKTLMGKLWQGLKNAFSHLILPYVEMIRGKGITRRWLLTTFITVGTVLIIVFIASVSFLHVYYYNTLQQMLDQRALVTAEYFAETVGTSVSSHSDSDFILAAQSFAEGFEDKSKMELQFINSKGRIVVSSSGFEPSDSPVMPDYTSAVSSMDSGAWNGKNENNEDVMAVCHILRSGGNYRGAVRLVVSMQPIDSTIGNIVLILILFVILVMLFITISSSYFIHSIVDPVRNLTSTAGAIANGNFEIRLNKQHDDEIGDLMDSINAMASQLALNEQAKNDFISSVSHELRTPLTAIKGWSETMIMSSDDKALMTRGLEIIANETQRLSGLVEQLLDFSRLQSGRMKINCSLFDIVDEISDVVFMFSEKAKKESKRLTFYEPDVPIPVMADKDRIKQVIIIVIDNAMKYSGTGGEIYVYTAVEGSRVTIGVRDHGCGIPADQLEKVKERFYKANTEKGGFGIGLAVADEIISRHNGEFIIDSVEGEGTNVSIILPLAKMHEADDMPKQIESQKDEINNEKE